MDTPDKKPIKPRKTGGGRVQAIARFDDVCLKKIAITFNVKRPDALVFLSDLLNERLCICHLLEFARFLAVFKRLLC